MSHSRVFLKQSAEIALALEPQALERLAAGLVQLRTAGGRLFLLGVGGSAANCSHAVNDFRKLCGIEAYTPVDNASELTARVNDDGWHTVFSAWLRTSQACARDAVLVLSVGGGNEEKNISTNIVHALKEAKSRGLKIFGIVGRDGGFTKQIGDEVIVIPTVAENHITPHTEAFQAVLWHCLVSHPDLQIREMKWESLGSARK